MGAVERLRARSHAALQVYTTTGKETQALALAEEASALVAEISAINAEREAATRAAPGQQAM